MFKKVKENVTMVWEKKMEDIEKTQRLKEKKP